MPAKFTNVLFHEITDRTLVICSSFFEAPLQLLLEEKLSARSTGIKLCTFCTAIEFHPNFTPCKDTQVFDKNLHFTFMVIVTKKQAIASVKRAILIPKKILS